jgi:hypothetical protein
MRRDGGETKVSATAMHRHDGFVHQGMGGSARDFRHHARRQCRQETQDNPG